MRVAPGNPPRYCSARVPPGRTPPLITFDTVTQAFTSPEQTKTAAGIVGTLITVAFAVSFTTALQRVYLRAWRRPPGGGPRNQAAAPRGSARSWCC